MVPGQEDKTRTSRRSIMTEEIALTNSGTTPVRGRYRFDETRLNAWMEGHIPGFSGPLTVEQFRGGQSNPTYKLITPDKTYVLRRKPLGAVLKGAHAVDREAIVLKALGALDYPVARVHGLCTDETVIGSPFYIMDMVEGRIFWDAILPDVERRDRWKYFDAMNAAIAALHNLDYQEAGLESFGRQGNYLNRQINRWTKQYREDEETGRDPYMDRLVEWLPAHIPPGDETRLIHGDFRIDNIIFHPIEPRIVAVLDWELSTLGHPLADFANHVMMYEMPPYIVAGLAGADVAGLGIPAKEHYISAYCRRTGRDGVPSMDFYIAFNLFRLAAIFHGIKGRVIRGTAANAHATERARNFGVISEIAWRRAQTVDRVA